MYLSTLSIIFKYFKNHLCDFVHGCLAHKSTYQNRENNRNGEKVH